MNNRYIKTLSNKTEIDIRKIVSVSAVSHELDSASYEFYINTQGEEIAMSFSSREKAQEERMRLIEIWYSIAAEDAMNSGILHYETRGE